VPTLWQKTRDAGKLTEWDGRGFRTNSVCGRGWILLCEKGKKKHDGRSRRVNLSPFLEGNMKTQLEKIHGTTGYIRIPCGAVRAGAGAGRTYARLPLPKCAERLYALADELPHDEVADAADDAWI